MKNAILLFPLLTLIVSACTEPAGSCSGFMVTSPTGDTAFTVPELMAHATALGMTQEEAETLIYLEGITSSATVESGGTLCIDGRPG